MGRSNDTRISLGIAIAHATTPPGRCRTFPEIAAYCGCDQSTVRKICERALKKLRHRLKDYRP